MAEITAVTRVLRGVCVRSDVKAGGVRLDTQYPQGHRQAPSIPFSMRHPSRGCPFKGIEPRMRPDHVNHLDADNAASRAGRPDSLAGLLVRRSLLRERLSAAANWRLPTDKHSRLSRVQTASKRQTAGRTFAASTLRGTGVR
jgi:hypothetical protein